MDEQTAFPKPRRNDGGEPCGECYLRAGERCDICGAVARPSAAVIEDACRAAVANSRPSADPDELTPAPRGMAGCVPLWKTYLHFIEPAVDAAFRSAARELGKERHRDD